MTRIAKHFLVLSLACLVATPALAGEKKKKPAADKAQAAKKEKKAKGFKLPKVFQNLDLTDEQVKKIQTINKDFAAKAKELATLRSGIVSKERYKAAVDAAKQAKADGKKGKELREAFNAALKLTDDEQPKLKDVSAKMKDLASVHKAAVMQVLTSEQNAKLAPKGKKPAKKKPAGDKAKKAKKAKTE